MRLLIALAAGSLFGIGLVVSDMVNPARVQAFLDPFGTWDPTLAFVMGGAIVPMAIAWQFAARRNSPALGGAFPAPLEPRLGHNLVVGSVLFGMGWGLAGLCPGPAIASLSWGGVGGGVFVAAMLAGMFAAPPVRLALDRMAPA